MSGTVLIDADVLAYRFAFAEHFEVDWGDGDGPMSLDRLEAAITAVNEYVEWIRRATDTDKAVMAMSETDESKCWRTKVYPKYKHTRREANGEHKPRPPLWRQLREYMEKTWTHYRRPTLEGDDVLGILATSPKIIKGRKVVCSIDKDLKQIPGELFNPQRPDDGVKVITPEEGDYMHLWQTLVGDSTDGYPGCPAGLPGTGTNGKACKRGVGEAGATKLLDADPSWETVKAAFEERGYTEEDALVQARIARICRREDYDFKRKEVILWTPPEAT